jgi:hypothetical protein
MTPKPVDGDGQGVLRAARDVVIGGAQVIGTLLAAPLLRSRYNRWGATTSEVTASMPGDDLVPHPRLGYTRAITVNAPPRGGTAVACPDRPGPRWS